ncbi:unnamed protein product [Rhizophagus irregularis]|nr:unnamed protein product [Rhizophagus irregularis]
MLLLFLILLGSLVLYEQMKVNVGISIANQPDSILLKPHRIRIMLVYRVGKFEARLVLLEQGSTVDEMALSFGQTQNDEEVMPVVTVPTVDVPDSVIDQLNNEVG